MATIRRSILGIGTVPDSSGDVFLEPISIKLTASPWEYLVVIFNDSGTRIGLHFSFDVPQDYVGAAKFIVVWTSTAIAGGVPWDVDYRAVGGNDTESLDQAGTQETVTVTDAAPSVTEERLEAIITPTAGNFVAGDSVQGTLFRDGVEAADDMAAAAVLQNLLFEYSDV